MKIVRVPLSCFAFAVFCCLWIGCGRVPKAVALKLGAGRWEVVDVFGPPNATFVNSEGLQIWVYEKMSRAQIRREFDDVPDMSVSDGEISPGLSDGCYTQADAAVPAHTSTQSSKKWAMMLKFDAKGVLVSYRFWLNNF